MNGDWQYCRIVEGNEQSTRTGVRAQETRNDVERDERTMGEGLVNDRDLKRNAEYQTIWNKRPKKTENNSLGDITSHEANELVHMGHCHHTYWGIVTIHTGALSPYILGHCHHTYWDIVTIHTGALSPYILGHCHHTYWGIVTIHTGTLSPYILGHCHHTYWDIVTIHTGTLSPYILGHCHHTYWDIVTIHTGALSPYILGHCHHIYWGIVTIHTGALSLTLPSTHSTIFFPTV